MIILGYSGFHHSVDFKKTHFPHLDPRMYRVAQGFDSAAALIVDNQIVASAAEERFTREKGTERFPLHAINFCLERSGLSLQDVDLIAHSFRYDSNHLIFEDNTLEQKRFDTVYSRQTQIATLENYLNIEIDHERFLQVPHHLAHAASTFYLSGFESALILIADGMGESQNVTLAQGKGNDIEIIKEIPEVHSLGILYSLFTFYLGFDFNLDEYKVMGLAPYGDHRRFFSDIMEMINLKSDGTVAIPILYINVTDLERETYSKSLAAIENKFGPMRVPGSEIAQVHKDIAAALQAVLQTSLLHILRYFKDKTGASNLCMAGGVALNCTANGYIKKSRLFQNIFIQPASGDDGAAVGAALYAANLVVDEHPNFEKLSMPFWGPSFDNAQIGEVLLQCGQYSINYYDDFDDLAQETARLIYNGKIIGCFQGRMEAGPRALGNRSILADPRDPKMRDKINALIKKREDFRPFAPAVLAEDATKYFMIEEGHELVYRHMLMITQVRKTYCPELPAVTHVDGSARVQTVFKDQCPRFWEIINQFGKLSGIPILLNTSFNVRGQPIVCTPTEALETFETAQLDALVIENYLVTRC